MLPLILNKARLGLNLWSRQRSGLPVPRYSRQESLRAPRSAVVALIAISLSHRKATALLASRFYCPGVEVVEGAKPEAGTHVPSP